MDCYQPPTLQAEEEYVVDRSDVKIEALLFTARKFGGKGRTRTQDKHQTSSLQYKRELPSAILPRGENGSGTI